MIISLISPGITGFEAVGCANVRQGPGEPITFLIGEYLRIRGDIWTDLGDPSPRSPLHVQHTHLPSISPS